MLLTLRALKAPSSARLRQPLRAAAAARAMSGTAPYTLYTQGTPNGHKASIVLEEVGAQYSVHEIHFSDNEQKSHWFLKINPNGRIPALVDHTLGDQRVFESGAIMIHIAEQHPDSGLLPKDPTQRLEVLSWLMFQMGGIGPMQGQANHFVRYAPEKIGYGMRRYVDEANRLYGVLEGELADGREWLVGSQVTLADLAQFPWVAAGAWAGVDIKAYPKLEAWAKRVYARPAVQKGLRVPGAENFIIKFMEDDTHRQEKLAEAQKIMQDAGADKAAEGANAAFAKK